MGTRLGARSRVLDGVKAGRAACAGHHDFAACGLDVAQLPLAVTLGLPLAAEDDVHRIGRTGRAGQHGRAVSLVSTSEAGLLWQMSEGWRRRSSVAVPGVATEPGR